MEKFKSSDVIAIIFLLGYFFLEWRGVAIMVPQAILILLGYYFGHSAHTSHHET